MSKLFMYGGTATAPVQLIKHIKGADCENWHFFIFINLINKGEYLKKMLMLRNIKSVNERI